MNKRIKLKGDEYGGAWYRHEDGEAQFYSTKSGWAVYLAKLALFDRGVPEEMIDALVDAVRDEGREDALYDDSCDED